MGLLDENLDQYAEPLMTYLESIADSFHRIANASEATLALNIKAGEMYHQQFEWMKQDRAAMEAYREGQKVLQEMAQDIQIPDPSLQFMDKVERMMDKVIGDDSSD